MTPEEQLKVLSRIWGNDRDGFVFLPWIPGTCANKEERRKNWNEGKGFAWPREKAIILQHLIGHADDDLYFSPNLFAADRRVEQNAEPERSLWADLDPVNPRNLEQRPTIAWESSPGRYQGVWILDRPRVGASWPGKENHRLSVSIGADPSGWDTTQVLRVPGRRNHKPPHHLGSKQGPLQGKLLWDNGPRYTWDDFEDLPEVPTTAASNELLDEDILASVDRHKVWAKVRLKLPQKIREYMAQRQTGGLDRSETAWQIERELADAGCTLAEIVVLIRPTVWNKYKARNNELHMLKTEASKAIAAKEESPVETLEDEEKPGIRWLNDVVKAGIPRPRWLVRDVWTRGSCGFISGFPKSYKSWFAMDLAVSVSTGSDFLGFDDFGVNGGPQPVLILQEEDDLRMVMSRLAQIVEAKVPDAYWEGQLVIDAAGNIDWVAPDRVIPLAVHVSTGFIASDEIWQAWLDNILAEGAFALVVIDTMSTTAGGIDTDKNAEVMSKMLTPLKVLAKKHDAAIAIVHHNKKGQANSRAGQDMLGSTAFHAWVESALYVRSKQGMEVIIERETKQAPDKTFKVTIPHMHTSDDERVLWTPIVDAEVLTEASEWSAASNDSSDDAQTRTGDRRASSNGGTAGRDMAWQLRQMGGTSRGCTAEHVASVRGMSLAQAKKQLDAAVKNGYLRFDEESSRYFNTDKE